MMRSPRLLFGSRFGGADAELAINRNGITIHNLAMKTGCEFKRKRGFSTGCGAKNYNQQGIARQLARAPMNVVPVTSDGDGENKDNDYDEADILQPLVWRRTTRAATLAVVQCFDHGAIVIEQTATTRPACGERQYPRGDCWPYLPGCHYRLWDETQRNPLRPCALG